MSERMTPEWLDGAYYLRDEVKKKEGWAFVLIHTMDKIIDKMIDTVDKNMDKVAK